MLNLNKVLFIILTLPVFFISMTSALRINEIMYWPEFDDNFNEWIELYNNEEESVNLEEFTLCGKSFIAGYIDRQENVNLDEGLILEAGGFVLITDGGSGTEVYDNYNVNEQSLAVHVDAATLCGRLTNTGKTIELEKNGQLYQEITYSDIANNGYSLEYLDGAFLESNDLGGSPGKENIFYTNESETTSENNSSEETNTTNGNGNNGEESTNEIEQTQESEQTKTKKAPITFETINLSPKVIKSEESKGYNLYAVFGFIAFCFLLSFLFILKLKKQRFEKNELA